MRWGLFTKRYNGDSPLESPCKHFKYWPLAILGPVESSSKCSMFNMFNGESPLQTPQISILGPLKYFELQKVQNVGKGVGW